jgi:hypothetical protein
VEAIDGGGGGGGGGLSSYRRGTSLSDEATLPLPPPLLPTLAKPGIGPD